MSIGDFPESLTRAMLAGCNVSWEIGRSVACHAGVREKTLLFCEPLPRNPAAATALQPMIRKGGSGRKRLLINDLKVAYLF